MKNISFYSALLLLVFACVRIDDVAPLKPGLNNRDLKANTGMKAIKNAWKQSGKVIYTFPADDQTVVAAYVVSSDASGNFYKTMIVQDAASNPQHGLLVRIDLKSYFTKYNFGRKIYLKMAGLSITSQNGNYIVGYLKQNKVEPIPESLLDDFLIRDAETTSITPKTLSFSEFSIQNLNQYIRVTNVQFRYDETGKTFSGEAFDGYTAERVLVQCENSIQSFLSTSTYARFKSLEIPDNKGSLNAVLTLDYPAKKFVLILNDTESMDFTQTDRCDPYFLDCSSGTNGENLVFFEDFENIKRTSDLEKNGWLNLNANLKDTKFKKRSVNGNAVMRISAYNTLENPVEAWLITPEIDLKDLENPYLSFETRASYDNGSIFTVWISEDFDGNVNQANWIQLKAKIANGPGGANEGSFTGSGKLSLNCLQGKIRIGFRYLGGDPGITTTYELDKIKIESDY